MGNTLKVEFCKCVSTNDTEEFNFNNTNKNNGKIDENNIKEYFNSNYEIMNGKNEVSSQGTFSILKEGYKNSNKITQNEWVISTSRNSKPISNLKLYSANEDDSNAFITNFNGVIYKNENDGISMNTFLDIQHENEEISDRKVKNSYNLDSIGSNIENVNRISSGFVAASSNLPLEVINEHFAEANTNNTHQENRTLKNLNLGIDITEVSDNPTNIKSSLNKYRDMSVRAGKRIHFLEEKNRDKIDRRNTDKSKILENSRAKSWTKQTGNLFNSQNYDIDMILNESKLLKIGPNDIIMHGELLKLSTENISNSYDVKSYAYSSRFCIITKSEFQYYNSKERFLKLTKPKMVIPLTFINQADTLSNRFFQEIQIKKLNNKENGQVFHFFLKIINLNNSLIPNSTTNKLPSSLDNSIKNINETSSFYKSYANSNINSHIVIHDGDSSNFNNTLKLSYLENSLKMSQYSGKPSCRSKKSSNQEKYHNLLIFGSNNENNIKTWLSVINYLIKYNK